MQPEILETQMIDLTEHSLERLQYDFVHVRRYRRQWLLPEFSTWDNPEEQ